MIAEVFFLQPSGFSAFSSRMTRRFAVAISVLSSGDLKSKWEGVKRSWQSVCCKFLGNLLATDLPSLMKRQLSDCGGPLIFLVIIARASFAVDDTWLFFILIFLMIPSALILTIMTVRRRLPRGLQTQRVEPQRIATEELWEFTRNTTQLDLHREPGQQLALLVHSIFVIDAVAIFDADLQKVYQTGEWFADLENVVRNVYFFESATEDPETGLTRRVLRIGNLPIGALLLRGEISPHTSSAIASLVAITFDRYHSRANVSRTESARQVEQLRSTVLDSLAHAYKTPLSAIRAASTGLTEMGSLTPAQFELVALIEEQSSVLNELTTRLLKTAKLEAHDLTLHTETVAVMPLIDDLVASFRERLGDIPVKIAVSREDLNLRCDRNLLVTLLTQYVDNAGKYSTAGSTVTIRVTECPGEVVFSVHNFGPVIPRADHERVFDRYFRCAVSANNVPGTGIGLSVAKRAAQAHGGDVWLTSDCERGTTFYASLLVNPNQGRSS
jgi:two-component system, OmpR family, sensor histidine kinase KdpD